MGTWIRWSAAGLAWAAAFGLAQAQAPIGEAARMPGERGLVRTVTLNSSGGYASAPIGVDTVDVRLVQVHGGACRARETWGWDVGIGALWVDGGCSATFQILTRGVQPVYPQGPVAPVQPMPPQPVRPQPPIYPPQPVYPSQPVYPQPPTGPSGQGYAPPVHPGPGYPPPPVYAPVEGRPIRGANNLCLDVRGNGGIGAPLIVYACHGRGNQRFAWTPGGELRVDGLCVDIANSDPRDGAAVVAWQCNGGRNQQWVADRGMIRSRIGGKCLTVWGPPRPEAPVAMAECRGQPGQYWRW